MTMSEQDRTLHRYELVERLAVGGMAEVFRAKAFGSHGFEKVLAIKRILPDLASDPEFETRFIAEAKLTVALTHANIVQVHDFGRFGGSLYIAMEYVDGPDLAALLKAYAERKQKIPVGAAMHIAMELAKGLDFAHRKGVVHHDVSPSNILLSRAGEVKVADFGIAQAAAESASGLSGARRIMGKWRYMSPEQTRGEKLDTRSDLFSAGVVIFELLTGERVFSGDEIETIVGQIRDMPIPKPSALRPDLPPALDEVLGRVLERDRAKRYGQASDLLRALTEISYARTLVATAMDVADVVAEAFPPAPLPGSKEERQNAARLIDDIIASELMAKQEQESRTVSRVTAQAAVPPESVATAATLPGLERKTAGNATFVRKVGPDGVTRLELTEDIAASQLTPARTSTSPPPDAGTASPRRRRVPTIAVLVLLALAVPAAIFLARQGTSGEANPTPNPVTNPSADDSASYFIDSTPQGALVLFDGVEKGRTPVNITAPPADADHAHKFELVLDGYRRFSDARVIAGPRGNYSQRVPLIPKVTRLEIHSDPDEADVELDDRPLGTTPYLADVPADDKRHLVRIRKKGYTDVTVPIELKDGETVPIERTLESAVKYGTVDIEMTRSWAYVYLGTRKLGEAPAQGIRVPAGKQHLKLFNPKTGVQLTIDVDVVAGKATKKRVDWPKGPITP